MGPMLKILNNKLQKEFIQIVFLLRTCFKAKELYNPWIILSNVVGFLGVQFDLDVHFDYGTFWTFCPYRLEMP
jgi:hypothetical protein